MKINLPVTQIEKPFPKGTRIVSKTDLKGMSPIRFEPQYSSHSESKTSFALGASGGEAALTA